MFGALLFAIILALSVGENYNNKEDLKEYTSGVDPELETFVKNFEDISGLKLKNINIRLMGYKKEVQGTAVGLCHTPFSGEKYITVDSRSWYFSDLSREALIFHELLHCVCDLDHDDSIARIDGETIKASILNKYALRYGEYTKHKSIYINDMKKKIREANCDYRYIRMEEKR